MLAADTLDHVKRALPMWPVVELRGAGGLVPGDPCGDFELTAVSSTSSSSAIPSSVIEVFLRRLVVWQQPVYGDPR